MGMKTIERRAIMPTTIRIVDTTLKIGSEIGSSGVIIDIASTIKAIPK
jgi:hypothetical protein